MLGLIAASGLAVSLLLLVAAVALNGAWSDLRFLPLCLLWPAYSVFTALTMAWALQQEIRGSSEAPEQGRACGCGHGQRIALGLVVSLMGRRTLLTAPLVVFGLASACTTKPAPAPPTTLPTERIVNLGFEDLVADRTRLAALGGASTRLTRPASLWVSGGRTGPPSPGPRCRRPSRRTCCGAAETSCGRLSPRSAPTIRPSADRRSRPRRTRAPHASGRPRPRRCRSARHQVDGVRQCDGFDVRCHRQPDHLHGRLYEQPVSANLARTHRALLRRSDLWRG